LPLPILYESRRRHIQRFLILSQLSIPILWFPLIKKIIFTQIQPETARFSPRHEAVFNWGQGYPKKGFGQFSGAAY
jgi:hypothetical protein